MLILETIATNMSVFVVTGARSGIGLGMVRILAKEPPNTVVAVIRDKSGDFEELKAIQSEADGHVHIVGCDISSEASVSQLGKTIVSALGHLPEINYLVNNAATLHSRHENSLNLSTDAFLSHITTNTLGPARVLQVLLPLLAPDAIVANISSGIASLTMLTDGRINAELTPYSISKTALNMLTVHQAKHLKGRCVVVCIDPGHAKTKAGGPEATLEVEDSAQGVLKVLQGLESKDSGKFLLYNGSELPW
jgi:NAD(P)-dependent dehydrogenase (short-subunit alcohol dehydrogenase family)